MQYITPYIQSGADSMSQAMSQVSLKDLEITGLKNQNKNLEDIAGKRENEGKDLEDKCKELVENNIKFEK